MKKYWFLAALFNCFIHLYAEVIECHRFSEIRSFLCPLDVIFTEIDEVLVSPTETIASISFLNHLKQNSLYEGLSLNQATTQLNNLWSKILQKAHFQLKEQDLPYYFRQLQNDQISIFGFTARPISSQSMTLKLMMKNGLTFNSFKPFIQEDILTTLNSDGLFFIPFDKRFEVLDALFKSEFLNPARVVFIDYNLMNLVQTQLFFEERKIPFLGIYFPLNNLSKTDYATQIGQIQLKYLHSLLPNSVAKSLIDPN